MKLLVYITTVLALLSSAANACSRAECDIPAGWMTLVGSESSAPTASINLMPEQIVLSKPFSFQLQFCQKHGKKGPDRVKADAIMPTHQHGMNYTPRVSAASEAGSFTVDGFVFHMPGIWEIRISSYRGDAVTQYTRRVTVK